MKRIVFTNDKGGVGKTTTVANIAVGVSSRGKRVLVIDMDPQADVTFALLGQRAPEAGSGLLPPTTHSLLTGHYPIDQVILQIPRYPNLALIPSNADLADAALKLANRPTRLRRLLDELPLNAYDLVLVDTGKGLDPLAVNALAAANQVIVMVTPGRLELDAITRMQEHVTLVREEVLLHASEPVIRGILVTQADPYSITRDTLQRINEQYPGLLLRTIIPKNNDLQKAIGRASSIFEVAPGSRGSASLSRFNRGVGLMKVQPLTGLGEPQPIGKRNLFQPPKGEGNSENVREQSGANDNRVSSERRVRTTISLSNKAMTAIMQIQNQYRLQTGRVLPLWKVVSQAIEFYGRSSHNGGGATRNREPLH